MSDQKKPANKKRRGIIAAVLVILILILALVFCVILLFTRSQKEGETQPDDGIPSAVLERGFVDENNADDLMAQLSEKVEEGMFECKMTTTWTFEDGTQESPNAYVANVASNRYALFFDVYEEESNELLYSSPVLPVGTELSDIKLDQELSAGDYAAVVMYTLVNEAYEEVSTVGFRITISVKK